MVADTEAMADLDPLFCHEMLLRLAGKAPDDLMTRCRGWLADGDFETLARGVSFFVISQNVALHSIDVALLAELLEDTGAHPDLAAIATDDCDPLPWYGFAAGIPQELAPVQTGPPAGPDKAEQALARLLAGEKGAIGCWRAWRFPADGSPWPEPKRIFVVEVGQSTDQVGLAARLQRKLIAVREPDPQVEVYQTGQELPVYQRFARGYGELIWAAAPDPGITIAAVFDSVDADGPHFSPGHARLDDEEATQVATYLCGGEPLLVTTTHMDDVIDPARTNCVPMSFRTDGTWLWADACAYYAAKHRLAPDADLLTHIQASGYLMPTVDGVAVHRALTLLRAASEAEPG